MKAKKFIKALQGMCHAHTKGEPCKGCELCTDEDNRVCGLLDMNPNKVLKAVKRWAKGASNSEYTTVITEFDELTLKEFVGRWLRHNTLVRLWVPTENGHRVLTRPVEPGAPLFQNAGMSWAIIDGTGWQAHFADWRVLYIADILCEDTPEAVNIVIDDPLERYRNCEEEVK